MNKFRAALLAWFSEAPHKWYAQQATQLRSVWEGAAWALSQISGGYFSHIRDILMALSDIELLDKVGFRTVNATADGSTAVSGEEEEMAGLAGEFCSCLAFRRARRCAWFWCGWPSGFVLFTSPTEAVKLGALTRLRRQWEAFEVAKRRKDKYWKEIVKRSIFKTLGVLQVVLALVASDWTLTSDIIKLCFDLAYSPWQERLAEDGFLRQRRQEAKAANLQLSPDAIWYCLLQRKVLDSVYKYDTLRYDLESTRHEELPSTVYHATANQASIDLRNIKGYSLKAPWVTYDPESYSGLFAEIEMTDIANAQDSWDLHATWSWLSSLFPMGKPLLVETQPGIWCQVLGNVKGHYVLVRPVFFRAVEDDNVLLAEPCDGDTTPVQWYFPVSIHINTVACEWYSPVRQQEELEIPERLSGSGNAIRMYAERTPVKLLVAAANNCFWTAKLPTLVKLCDCLKLSGFVRSSLSSVLYTLLMHLLPHLDEEGLYDLVLKRAPHSELFCEIMEVEQFEELIEKSDKDAFDKSKKKHKEHKAQIIEFHKHLAGLRSRIIARAKAALAASPMDEKTKAGPVSGESHSWDEIEVNRWCPPRARVLMDHFNKRWRCSYHPRKNVSRAWALYGFEQSLRMVLVEAWTSWHYHRGVQCPIGNLFPVGHRWGDEGPADAAQPASSSSASVLAAEAPADAAVPASAPSAKAPPSIGKSRGRGKGRGRGRNAAGDAAAAAASTVEETTAVDAAEDPSSSDDAAALSVPSRKSSSSSNSSSSSSSSDS